MKKSCKRLSGEITLWWTQILHAPVFLTPHGPHPCAGVVVVPPSENDSGDFVTCVWNVVVTLQWLSGDFLTGFKSGLLLVH